MHNVALRYGPRPVKESLRLHTIGKPPNTKIIQSKNKGFQVDVRGGGGVIDGRAGLGQSPWRLRSDQCR